VGRGGVSVLGRIAVAVQRAERPGRAARGEQFTTHSSNTAPQVSAEAEAGLGGWDSQQERQAVANPDRRPPPASRQTINSSVCSWRSGTTPTLWAGAGLANRESGD